MKFYKPLRGTNLFVIVFDKTSYNSYDKFGNISTCYKRVDEYKYEDWQKEFLSNNKLITDESEIAKLMLVVNGIL